MFLPGCQYVIIRRFRYYELIYFWRALLRKLYVCCRSFMTKIVLVVWRLRMAKNVSMLDHKNCAPPSLSIFNYFYHFLLPSSFRYLLYITTTDICHKGKLKSMNCCLFLWREAWDGISLLLGTWIYVSVHPGMHKNLRHQFCSYFHCFNSSFSFLFTQSFCKSFVYILLIIRYWYLSKKVSWNEWIVVFFYGERLGMEFPFYLEPGYMCLCW
jgi:hypothetical protein